MNPLRRDVRLGAISALVILGTVIPSAFAASGNATSSLTATSGSTSIGFSGSSNTSNALPEVKLTQADALQIVKGLFPNLFSTSDTPEVSLQTGFGEGTGQVYLLSWTPKAFHHQSGPQINQSYTNAMIDANTGQLIQFQHTASQWTETGKTISTDKAQGIATTWLKNLAPSQADTLVLQPSSGATNTGFAYQFIRKVNGIIAPFDSATVNLDQSGNLSMYRFSWHDATFNPMPEKVMNITDATAKYREDLILELRYQQLYGPIGIQPLKLVYQSQNLNSDSFLSEATPILDAESGQLVGLDGLPLISLPSTDLSPLVAGGPIEFPKVQSEPISQVNLEKQVATQFGLTGDEWALSGVQQQTNNGGPTQNHPILDINYMNQKTHENVNVQVDMLDGVIVNYNGNPGAPGSTSNLASSATDVQALADAFVKKLFPQLTGAISHAPEPKVFGMPNNQESFDYDFLVNGVPVQGFHVNIDTNSGTVMYYNLMQDPGADFPSVKNAISADTAKTDYLKREPVVLQYVLPETADRTIVSGFPIQYGNQAHLVYAAMPLPNGTGNLDALTGDWIDAPNGLRTTVNPPQGATEAEKAMAILEQNGVVIGDEGKANLSAPISHAEFIAWLSRAYNYHISGSPAPQFSDVSTDNPYAQEISTAIMQGWLTNSGNLNPSADLTRDDASRWLVEWMDWQGPAAHIEFFKIPYRDATDVPVKDRGAATMTSAAGILPLENGKFNPNQKLTVGDTAIALVNAIHVLLGENS